MHSVTLDGVVYYYLPEEHPQASSGEGWYEYIDGLGTTLVLDLEVLKELWKEAIKEFVRTAS